MTEIAFFSTGSFLGFSRLNQLCVCLCFAISFVIQVYLGLQLDQRQSRQEIAGTVNVLKLMDPRHMHHILPPRS